MNLTFLCLPVESCSILSKNVKSIYLSWSTWNTYVTGVKMYTGTCTLFYSTYYHLDDTSQIILYVS